MGCTSGHAPKRRLRAAHLAPPATPSYSLTTQGLCAAWVPMFASSIRGCISWDLHVPGAQGCALLMAVVPGHIGAAARNAQATHTYTLAVLCRQGSRGGPSEWHMLCPCMMQPLLLDQEGQQAAAPTGRCRALCGSLGAGMTGVEGYSECVLEIGGPPFKRQWLPNALGAAQQLWCAASKVHWCTVRRAGGDLIVCDMLACLVSRSWTCQNLCVHGLLWRNCCGTTT
jgi:hypothetical protein